MALSHTSALVDELELMGPALGDNPEKIGLLWKELKQIRSNLAEVASLAQHLTDVNDVNMASLHFQQASAPLLTRLNALSEKYGQVNLNAQIPGSSSESERASDEKSTKKVSLSGWLKKRGEGKLSNSHRRYFLLDQAEPTQLRYFENDSLTKQKGYIPLDLMEALLVNDNDKTQFGINTGERIWELQADTEHDARIWVKALSKWGERFQQLKMRKNQTSSKPPPSQKLTSSQKGSLEVPATSPRDRGDVSPRSTIQDSTSPAPTSLDTAAAIDESLIKLQQEAERREALRQQESTRRWKEKQELRFQRQAQQLKEEANMRYLTSSESQDLGVSSGPSGPAVASKETSNQSAPSTLSHEDHSESGSAPSTVHEGEPATDSNMLREKLRAALKIKRERNLIIADLLHQRSLLNSLKSEKLAEMKKIEDSDATVVQMRDMRDESKLLAKHLVSSIATYQQQILEQDKLIGLIQGSIKQNNEKATQLQSEIEKTRQNLEALEPPFTTLSLELSHIAVSRMVAHTTFKSSSEVEEKIDMLSEALKAHEDLAHLTQTTFQSREATLQKSIQEHTEQVAQLRQTMDATRHHFQFLRSLLHTDAGYSITEEIEELQHDYFVAIVNGIKLNLIQEGHTLKLTSPSLLFAQAKSDNIPRRDWPNWISAYIHSKCIETYPEKLTRAVNSDHMGPQHPHEGQNAEYSLRARIHERTTRKRVKNHFYGASFGNFGGGGLGMM